MEVPQKIKNRTTIQSSMPYLELFPKEMNIVYQRATCTPVGINIKHNSQDLQ